MSTTYVIAHRQPTWGQSIGLYLQKSDGVRVYAGLEIIWVEVEPGTASSPAAVIENTEAQALMDSLRSCGVRPTEGAGSAGSFAAQSRHLADMRALVADALNVELP